MTSGRRQTFLSLPPLFLFWAAALHRLGAASFWYDEAFNLDLTLAHSWGGMLDVLLREQPYPPLYHLLLKLWEGGVRARPYAPGLEPSNGLEFVMRFTSAAAGMWLLALLLPLGKRLGLRWAWALPWLLALHPTLLWYARDLRLYTLWAFLVAASLWAMMARRWRRAALLGTAAMLTHYFSLFPLGAASLLVFLHERRRKVLPFLAAPFLAAAVWMGIAWRVTFGFHSFATTGPPSFATFLRELGPQLLLGSAFLAPTGEVPPAPWGFRLLAAATLGLLLLALRHRAGRMVAAAFLLGAAATFAVWQVRPVHHVRYLIWALPLAGAGILALVEVPGAWGRGGRLWRGAMVGLMVIALWGEWRTTERLLRADPTLWRPDFRAAVALLNREAEAGDRLIAQAAHGAQLLSAYRTSVPVVEGTSIGAMTRPDEALRFIGEGTGRRWTLLYQDDAVDPGGVLIGTLEANGGYRTAMLYTREVRLFAYTLPSAGPFHPLEPTLPLTATFDGLRLEGAALHREGRLLSVYLFWRLERPLEAGRIGAVHLTAQIGTPPLAQRDKPILSNYWPLSRLPVGERLPDRYEIVIPPELPPGRYVLYALVYDPVNGQRFRTAAGEELVPLGTLVWAGE